MLTILGYWELVVMSTNGHVVVDNEDRSMEQVKILYEFRENGEYLMSSLVRTIKGNWHSDDKISKTIEMSSPDETPNFVGYYFFSRDRLVLKGHIGNDEMHMSLKRMAVDSSESKGCLGSLAFLFTFIVIVLLSI